MSLSQEDLAQITAMIGAPTVGEGFNNPIVAGQNLLIPAIQSPNFVPGVSGWAIFANGTAQFNQANIIGTITGSTINGGTINGTTISGSSVTADILNVESANSGVFVYALL